MSITKYIVQVEVPIEQDGAGSCTITWADITVLPRARPIADAHEQQLAESTVNDLIRRGS